MIVNTEVFLQMFNPMFPRVSVADSVRAIAAGDKVVITCTAQGSPKPELIRVCNICLSNSRN